MGVKEYIGVTHPELAAQLKDPSLATSLTASSSKKTTWLCGKGHEYEASVGQRRSNGSGCPFCSGHRVLPGFNDLATTHPEVAAQLKDQSLTTSLTAGSNKKVFWVCAEGHEWKATVFSRSKGSGCPFCSGRLAIPGETDLATLNPELAAQLKDPSLATSLTVSTSKKSIWLCDKGHEYEAPVSHRTRGNGCPFCAGQKVLPGYNDLATLNPGLAAQLKDPSLATTLTANSGKKPTWLCEEGHEWEATVNSRKRGNACPFCSGRFAIPGETDLATTNPGLAAQLKDQSLATSLMAVSSKKPVWLCEEGHEWEAVVANRANGNNCPFCSGQKVLPGYNDLATTHPEVAAQLKDPSLATTLTFGSDNKPVWICAEGHEYEATVAHRTGRGGTCPFCAGQKVLPGYNDLATTHPELAAQLKDQSIATTLTAGSTKKTTWLCDKGHEWKATVNNRSKGRGCPACAEYGFDQTQPAFVYLVSQQRLHAEDSIIVKLGIANTSNLDARLAKHASQGLTEVLRTREYPLGSQALEKETEFKHYLKKLHSQFRVTKDELPDGFTEAFLSTAPGWEEHADLAC